MIEIMALKIFIEAIILGGILSLVAKHEADLSFSKVAMVAAINSVASFMLGAFLSEQMGHFVAIPILLLSFYIIKTMCWLTAKKAIITVMIFSVFFLSLDFGAAYLIRKLDRAMHAPMEQGADRMQRKQQEILDSLEGIQPGGSVAPRPAPVARPVPVPVQTAQPIYVEPAPTRAQTATPVSKEQLSETLRTKASASDLPGEWQEARKLIRVDGIVAGANKAQMALVRGKMHRTGDRISVRYGAKTYTWKIKQISKSGLDLEPVTAR